MAKTKKAAAKVGREAGPKAGNVRLVVQVRPDQVDAVVAEAGRRRPAGAIRADTSAVVRDALDAYPPLKPKR